MVSSFKDYTRKYYEKLEEIEKLSKSYVKIGFQEGSVTKSQSKGKRRKLAGKSMPQIAAENEFGTNHIPARPFMSTSFDENRAKINQAVASEYDKILEGTSTVKKSLGLLGLLGVDLIQQKIRAIRYPPNSPRTIAIKKSSKPLIDFGQMISTVTYKTVIT